MQLIVEDASTLDVQLMLRICGFGTTTLMLSLPLSLPPLLLTVSEIVYVPGELKLTR